MTPAEFLTIARLKKTQGRRGEIAADLLTDFPERFAERKRILLLNLSGERRSLEIENHWFHKGLVVLKFSGIDSINDAEALLLQGHEVQIPASEAAPLDKDTVFVHDLVGCSLFDAASGREAGVIEDVTLGAGSAPLLIVKVPGQSETECMIPFAEEYVEQIDTANKRIRMRLPAGLLEINRPVYDDGLLPGEQNPGELKQDDHSGPQQEAGSPLHKSRKPKHKPGKERP